MCGRIESVGGIDLTEEVKSAEEIQGVKDLRESRTDFLDILLYVSEWEVPVLATLNDGEGEKVVLLSGDEDQISLFISGQLVEVLDPKGSEEVGIAWGKKGVR